MNPPTPDKIAWWAGSVFLRQEEVVKLMNEKNIFFFMFPGIWNIISTLHDDSLLEFKCIIPTQAIYIICLHYEEVIWSLKPLVAVN